MLTFWLYETRLEWLIDGVGSFHSYGNSVGNSRSTRRRRSGLPAVADDDRNHGVAGPTQTTPHRREKLTKTLFWQ